MGANVRAVGITGSLCQRPLGIGSGGIELADLALRKGAGGLEPPVAGAGRIELRHKVIKRLLAPGQPRETDQPEDARAGRHDHEVARPGLKVRACRGHRAGCIAHDHAFERVHMAALALALPGHRLHRAGDGRAGIGATAMQLMGTGEHGMSERAARVGINGALRRGLHAGQGAQKTLDRIEIGLMCGGRVGRHLESEGIFESHRAGLSGRQDGWSGSAVRMSRQTGKLANRQIGVRNQPIRQASTAGAHLLAPLS